MLLNLLLFAGMHGLFLVNTIRCNCNDPTCNVAINDGDCDGEYCYMSRQLPTMPVHRTGCLTTRQDVSTITCEKNRKGVVLCLCNTDYCNSKDLPVKDEKELPLLVCHIFNKRIDKQDNLTCRGHSCFYRTSFIHNEFGDLREETTEAGCSAANSQTIETTIGLFTSGVDTAESHCVHSQDSPDSSYLTCHCRQNLCNTGQQTAPPIGSTGCYLHVPGKPLTYCNGDFCTETGDGATVFPYRGCVSIRTENNTPLKDFETKLGNRTVKWCSYDLCNGKTVVSTGFQLDSAVALPFLIYSLL